MLRNKLNYKAKDFYTKNYKTLLKEIKEDIHKWKDILFPWIGRLNVVKVSITTKTIYRINAIPIKSQWQFLQKQKKKILKFIGNDKGLQITKTMLRKKNKAGDLTPSDFKTYYKTRAIKITWVLVKRQIYKSMEQSREPRNKHTHVQSTDLQHGCQEYTMRKGQSLQQSVSGKLDIHMQKNETGPLSYTHKYELKMSQTFM